MYALLALVAVVLTSLLPVLNKRLLQRARPALVAWGVNAASLPLLAAGTAVLTQCHPAPATGVLACTPSLPRVDAVFAAALVGSAALNWVAMLLSIRALAGADASLVSPLLTFNPAFTLPLAWTALGEVPGLRQTLGVGILLLGAYLLDVEAIRAGVLEPLRVLLRRPATVLAIVASACWGVTTVLEKLAIEHATPPSGPLVALASTALMVALLTPGAFRSPGGPRVASGGPERGLTGKGRVQGTLLGSLAVRPWAFLAAALIAGVAPLFGFSALALGLVGYVAALFKLGAVLTILWAWLFLGEGHVRARLLGAAVMVAGGALVAG